MANTYRYQEEWETKLQERLDHPTCWDETLHLVINNDRVRNAPYIAVADEPAVATGASRGSAYALIDVTESTESVTISNRIEAPIYIDSADEAQSNYAKRMDLAKLQGRKMKEKIEALTLGKHADWTNIGDTGGGAVGLGASALTVSASNIDDIIRGIFREVIKANGLANAQERGLCVVWRPQDFEYLTAFMQANGFGTADMALKEGVVPKVNYMLFDHYISNDFTAGHLFAGVKKTYELGILKATYGKTVEVQHPVGLVSGVTWGNMAGTAIYTGMDYAYKAWTLSAPTIFDVNVA